MTIIKSKLKIFYQTKQNINDNCFNNKNLNKKKWKFFPSNHQLIKKNKENLLIKPIKVKTLYKERLINYQKFNYFYGKLKKKQLKKQFYLLQTSNNIIDNIILNLEKRVDMLLYRTRIFKSLFEVQQKINHNTVQVNFKIISSKNYQLKIGDYIYFSSNTIYKTFFLPPYLEYNSVLNIFCLFKEPKIKDCCYSFTFNKLFLLDYLK